MAQAGDGAETFNRKDQITMSDEEDYPEIGYRKKGYVLVCRGDDVPDEWDYWLEELVDDFKKLAKIACEHSVEVDAGEDYGTMEDWRGFCEALGVNFESEFWEGGMISGLYMKGWIKPGKVDKATKTGKEILKRIRQNLLERIRSNAIAELEKIEDLDRLDERTRDDRKSLISQNAQLKTDRATAEKTAATLERALAAAKVNDTSELALNCLRIACAVLNQDRMVLLAGPLVLWADGVVYAFTTQGKVHLPTDSAPWILLKELEREGHPVVEVGEDRFLHPSLLDHISRWINVWQQVESRERVFLVADPAQLAVAHQIHEHFKTPPPA